MTVSYTHLDVYKRQDGKKYLAHTLNNTVVAPPRMLIAFLENNLNADGSVTVSYTHIDVYKRQDAVVIYGGAAIYWTSGYLHLALLVALHRINCTTVYE